MTALKVRAGVLTPSLWALAQLLHAGHRLPTLEKAFPVVAGRVETTTDQDAATPESR